MLLRTKTARSRFWLRGLGASRSATRSGDIPEHWPSRAAPILRLWRTFCVNYEAGTEREPEEKKAKGKIKNYKLKHSRLLTCYSAVLYLLAIYEQQKSVHPQDVLNMIGLTPTGRLEWLRDQNYLSDAKDTIERLLRQYERFLETTDAPESELINRFMDKEQTRRYFDSAYEFGDLVFDALTQIGKNTRFHRLLVV